MRESAGLFDRGDRGLAIVTGPERATWLHNVVSNAVKTVDANAGVYAFALDIRGRVQFDINILVLMDEIWLDLDLQALPAALAHLNKFLIMEKAAVTDATTRFARLGVAGPRAAGVAERLGVANFAALPALQSVWIDHGKIRFFRHDFAGLPGFELILPYAQAAECWSRLSSDVAVRPAGFDALDALRIEAGIPWLGRDIDEKTIAPETGQVERAISYNKGCYLGQEVIERMRSHGSLARRLVRVSCEPGTGLTPPAALRQGTQEVGRITSLVKHPNEAGYVGLGYLRTSVSEFNGITAGDAGAPIVVTPIAR